MQVSYRKKLHAITTFVFDFDGVLSDGKIYTLPDGDMIRATHVKDGHAIHQALNKGYRIAIITGGYSETIPARFRNFGQIDVFMKVVDKAPVFNQYLAQYNIAPEEVLFMGDDIPDLPLMHLAGVACCPADAAIEIKAVADYISFKNGGDGCVRDVIEQTLRIHENW
ncbi:MAG: HAD hydrolase family protein [Bacteroidales bacterium]|jgi:3-deoxy-D-manno-octulosonate 8-phosphate phosphatase (KDO 8-P phosphatase)|nr:HAD hydrolase family protein [Bacteroidales bacterium]